MIQFHLDSEMRELMPMEQEVTPDEFWMVQLKTVYCRDHLQRCEPDKRVNEGAEAPRGWGIMSELLASLGMKGQGEDRAYLGNLVEGIVCVWHP